MSEPGPTDSYPMVSAAWVERICRSYASIVDAHLIYLGNLQKIAGLLRSGDRRGAVILACNLETAIAEDRAVLGELRRDCESWQRRLSEIKAMSAALVAHGVTFDEHAKAH